MPLDVTITHKKCSKCGETKEISEFGRRKVSSDGYKGQCKQCVRNYNTEYDSRTDNRTNPVRPDSQPDGRSRCCIKCGERKDFSEFRRRSNLFLGIDATCKVCAHKIWQQYAKRFDEK